MAVRTLAAIVLAVLLVPVGAAGAVHGVPSSASSGAWPADGEAPTGIHGATDAGVDGENAGADGEANPGAGAYRPPGNVTGLMPSATTVTAAGTVVDVARPDVLVVRFADGERRHLRLLGVDAPDRGVRTDPTKFPGVPDTYEARTCLAGASADAESLLAQRVRGETVRVRFEPGTETRDDFGRLVGLATVDDVSVNRMLVAAGYARATDDLSPGEGFGVAEAAARDADSGLWTCGTLDYERATADNPTVERLRAEVPRNVRDELDREFIRLNNTGEEALNLSGWTIRDGDGHVYRFDEPFRPVPDPPSDPTFVLEPGQSITLHTGTGRDEPGRLFWGLRAPVWDEDGDVIVVRSADSTVHLYLEYGDRDDGDE